MAATYVRNWSWGVPPKVRTYVRTSAYVRTSTGGLPGPARRGTIGGYVPSQVRTYYRGVRTRPTPKRRTYVRTYCCCCCWEGEGYVRNPAVIKIRIQYDRPGYVACKLVSIFGILEELLDCIPLRLKPSFCHRTCTWLSCFGGLRRRHPNQSPNQTMHAP